MVRRVQADVAALPDALVAAQAAAAHPVLTALARAVVADLDHYARRGRLPRRPDLYGFRAYAALGGAAGLNEDVLVDRINSSIGAVVRLWCAAADELAGEFSADAIDRGLASLCGIARMWARKVRAQLTAGLALAAAAWPLDARTAPPLSSH